jgi:hypothetical protein
MCSHREMLPPLDRHSRHHSRGWINEPAIATAGIWVERGRTYGLLKPWATKDLSNDEVLPAKLCRQMRFPLHVKVSFARACLNPGFPQGAKGRHHVGKRRTIVDVYDREIVALAAKQSNIAA